MKRFFFITIAVLVTSRLVAGISFIDVNTLATYEKMLDLARMTNKDILIYVDDANCPNCKALTKQTFRNKALNQYVNDNYLALKVSASSGFGQTMINLYTVKDVPAILALNAYEIIFKKHEGFSEAPELLKLLQEANALAGKYQTWARGAAAGSLSKLEYIQFLLIEYENNRVTAGHRIIREISSMLDSADFSNPLVLRFIQELCLDIDGPIFQTILQKPNWITDTVNFSWADYHANVYNYNVDVAITKKDSIFLEDALLRIQQLPHFLPVQNFAFKGRQLYLAELNKWTAYDTLTFAYLEALPADSADAYQREAIHLMEYYAQPQAKNIALKYLRKGLEKKETFKLYYTLSLWLYKYGDLTNAYKAAYTAEKFAATADEQKLARQMQLLIEQQYY
jgi:hypothetical protein